MLPIKCQLKSLTICFHLKINAVNDSIMNVFEGSLVYHYLGQVKKIVVSRPDISPIRKQVVLTICYFYYFSLFNILVDDESQGHDIVKRRARKSTHALNTVSLID